MPLLNTANNVVAAMSSTKGMSLDPAEEAKVRLVNVAGRQRMLTQRAAKAHCMIAAGINPEESLQELRDTVGLFDQSLLALLNGHAQQGLQAPPDDVVRYQLNVVRDLWAPVRAHYLKALNGDAPARESLEFVSKHTDAVLSATNIATFLYESAELD